MGYDAGCDESRCCNDKYFKQHLAEIHKDHPNPDTAKEGLKMQLRLLKKVIRMNFQKIAVATALLLLAASIFSGCAAKQPAENSDPQKKSSAVAASSSVTTKTDSRLADLHKAIDESGFQAGIAYIGYVGSKATEDEMYNYLKSSPYAEKYSFLCDSPLIDAGGTELYAVVTTRENRSASVYHADMNNDGTYDVHTDKILYKGKGTDCILLRCNPSELHSNVSILFTAGDEHFYVNPMISGANGRLNNTYCYDFSVYSDDEGISDDVINAYCLLSETDEVKYYTDLGMSLKYTGQTQNINGQECQIFAIGTNHEEQFVKEIFYAVSKQDKIYFYDVISDKWDLLGNG